MPSPLLLLSDGIPRWFIQTHVEGKVLDVAGAAVDDGAEVIQWAWNGGPQQRFVILPLPDGQFWIAASHSGRLLDVAGDGDAGAKVIQWEAHLAANQRWRFEPTGDHWGRFVSVSRGLVLDVQNGSKADRASLVVAHANGGANQSFKPFYRRDGRDVFLDERV